jgi:hypothetical protein
LLGESAEKVHTIESEEEIPRARIIKPQHLNNATAATIEILPLEATAPEEGKAGQESVMINDAKIEPIIEADKVPFVKTELPWTKTLVSSRILIAVTMRYLSQN